MKEKNSVQVENNVQEESGVHIKRGLRRKMFILCAAMVLAASVGFGVIGIVQLRGMLKLASDTNETQNHAIQDLSQQTLSMMILENMVNTVEQSAQNADYQFWTMKHDFTMMADQVQDIFEHPEKYGEREVLPPDKANAGELVLQLVFSDPAVADDAETMTMVRKLANLEPMMREIVRNNDLLTRDCYLSLPVGVTLEMDPYSDHKFNEDGTAQLYDPASRPWYKTAVGKGKFAFTLSVKGYYMNTGQVQCGIPIYVNGELKAVLQGSTQLTRFHELISDVGVGDEDFSIMVSDDGYMIYSPRESGELMMTDDLSRSLWNSENRSLVELLHTANTNDLGIKEVEIDGISYVAAHAKMPTSGWFQFTFVPESEFSAPTERLLDEMKAIGTRTREKFRSGSRQSNVLIVIVIVILIGNAFLAAMIFSGKVMNPINKMTGKLRESSGEEFDFQMEDAYRTGDEIEILANTFGKLSEKMHGYLKNILSMTAEKERIGTELSIATKIQADMLPDAEKAITDRDEFSLYASMNPAKEVGGDFYDFFMIDDDHLCLVIADVSDKGIPSALFMMSSMMIINNRARQGGTPGEILTDANVQIWKNNKTKMFVTVWLGILELSTGKMVCTNAGHEFPVIRGADGVFRVYPDKHGLVVGALGKSKYKDYELQLEPNDAVFVYTDGVPEANNADGEFYGMERLTAALNRTGGQSPKEILESVRKDVDAFVAGAKQFDDLTMLCLEYKGSGS